MQVTFSQASDY